MDLTERVTEYYAARAPEYDETAGYTEAAGEALRAPIKARYREMFAGHDVLEIACGTGYWTAVIAETARSVFAFDVNPSVLAVAKDRCRGFENVTLVVADAYAMDAVPGGFSAAFAVWWWSHVPRQRLHDFLSALHARLVPGALVLFVDQLRYDGPRRRQDAEGNTLEARTLPDGRRFEIVKNFPSTEEVAEVLRDLADDVEVVERPAEKSWSVSYRTKGGRANDVA